jgi:type IV pilus assembly protein PilM
LSFLGEKMFSSFSKNQAFGLDFNNSSLRILQLNEDNGKLKVEGWSERKFAGGVFENFEITKVEKFKETFDMALESAKGKIFGRKAVISIPENKVFTRVISIPEIDPAEASEAVKWETEANIPISIEDVYYDWQIIRKIGKKMDVLVVATPKKIIDNYLLAMDKTGIEVVACEAESIATGRSVIEKGNRDFLLVVDIGLDSASFAIYQGSMPVFTSSSNATGRMFTSMVAKELGLTEEKAEAYKIRNGLLGTTDEEKNKNIEIFKSVLAILYQEIEKTINFFGSTMNSNFDNQIKKVILTGGASNLKGLPEFLSEKLKKEVCLSNPWINLDITGKVDEISSEKAQSLATVIGLSIRAQNYESYN